MRSFKIAVAVAFVLSYALLWVRDVRLQHRVYVLETVVVRQDKLVNAALSMAANLEHEVSGKRITPPMQKKGSK